jgi:putative ABC transport system permease protein
MYGRTFEPAETLPNGPRVAVLTYELWKSAFGGTPAVLGSEIEVNGLRRTVVGIMPPRFDVADQHVEVWAPLVIDPANRRNRGNHYLYLIGRLAGGATLQGAQAELDTLLAGWPSTIARAATATNGPHTPDTKNHRLRLDPLQMQIVGSARTAVFVLQGAVIFVLLIACANLANLLLARAESRHKEFAVRSALGAGRWRLLRQFMVEGCLLSFTGAALGLGVAVAGVRALIAAYPESLPRSADCRARPRRPDVYARDWAGDGRRLRPGTAAASCAGCHLARAEGRWHEDNGRRRPQPGSAAASSRRKSALAVALVIGAGLLLRTVMNLSNVDSGFKRGQLVTFAVTLPNATYARPEQKRSFYQRLIEQLRSTSGVQSVAGMTGLPPLRQVDANDTMIEGYVAPPEGPFNNVDYYQTVTTGYVETMGIPVVEGRAFQPSDAMATTVLINETMARTFYKGQSPIGRRVKPSSASAMPFFTIVGVLKDVKQGGVDQKTGTELYFNFEQLTTTVPQFGVGTMNIVLRTTQPPNALAGTIHQAVGALDPSLPIEKLRSMDDVFGEAIGRPRLLAQLLGIFAGLAILLAAIGSYGVLSYMVTERRREIGIRMALGADRGSVMRMVLSQGLRLTLIGVIAGLAAAFAMNRVLASLLFGVRPSDPATIASVVTLIGAVALVACYIPARVATRVDPMIVLREE